MRRLVDVCQPDSLEQTDDYVAQARAEKQCIRFKICNRPYGVWSVDLCANLDSLDQKNFVGKQLYLVDLLF